EELSLLDQVSFELDNLKHEDVQATLEAAGKLAKSLLSRSGIPKARVRYFTAPDLNIGSHGKSRKEVFETNGTHGEDILRHAHFLPHLRYFIYGPDLPASSIKGFCQILNEDAGTSGMVLDQLNKFVRAEVRRERLTPSDAAEEFFKLSHELGLDEHLCRMVRDAALNTR